PLPLMQIGSYMWFVVLFVLWMIFSIITPLAPRGLMIHVPQPGTLARADEPWNKPLVVRVDAWGHCYLNRQFVPISELGLRLELALSIRGDRTIFIDGDQNTDAGDV